MQNVYFAFIAFFLNFTPYFANFAINFAAFSKIHLSFKSN
jgi:hypothetical protein